MKAPVLALRGVGVDDVVVEVVRAVARRDGEQLGTGRMHENAAQTTDLGRDMGGHGPKLTSARQLVQPDVASLNL